MAELLHAETTGGSFFLILAKGQSKGNLRYLAAQSETIRYLKKLRPAALLLVQPVLLNIVIKLLISQKMVQ